MTMYQLNKTTNEDHPGGSSASKGQAKRPSVCVMAAPCGLQGTSSRADDLPDTGPNTIRAFTRTSSDATQHVDLEDPFSLQQFTAGSKCENEFRHRGEDEGEDEQWSARSRSSSTATLDFSPKEQSRKDSINDEQSAVGMFDRSLESMEMTGTRGCTTLDAHNPEVIPQNNGYSMPTCEPLQDGRNLRTTDSSPGLISDQRSNMTSSVQPHKEASSESRRQLPRMGRWPAWNSAINVAAFEALPGPLFTRPKQALDAITYEAVMEGKTKQEAKEAKRKHNKAVCC
ncbi:hypothetical protein V8C35DRAFT_305678 [Trichoderma chlorosporum]